MPRPSGDMAERPTLGWTITPRVGHSVMSPSGQGIICIKAHQKNFISTGYIQSCHLSLELANTDFVRVWLSSFLIGGIPVFYLPLSFFYFAKFIIITRSSETSLIVSSRGVQEELFKGKNDFGKYPPYV